MESFRTRLHLLSIIHYYWANASTMSIKAVKSTSSSVTRAIHEGWRTQYFWSTGRQLWICAQFPASCLSQNHRRRHRAWEEREQNSAFRQRRRCPPSNIVQSVCTTDYLQSYIPIHTYKYLSLMLYFGLDDCLRVFSPGMGVHNTVIFYLHRIQVSTNKIHTMVF